MSMTENKALETALEKVKAQKENFGFLERFDVDENWEVTKALEEVQQYRAIGTVEELQGIKQELFEAVSDWRQYRKIGTISEFRELKEKATAKRVVDIHKSECPDVIEDFGENTLYGCCPTCNSLVNTLWSAGVCGDCGTALDWSEGKE